ncbi:MAG: hypothetical protein AAGK22_28495 [Acidobacteriota bacterium]
MEYDPLRHRELSALYQGISIRKIRRVWPTLLLLALSLNGCYTVSAKCSNLSPDYSGGGEIVNFLFRASETDFSNVHFDSAGRSRLSGFKQGWLFEPYEFCELLEPGEVKELETLWRGLSGSVPGTPTPSPEEIARFKPAFIVSLFTEDSVQYIYWWDGTRPLSASEEKAVRRTVEVIGRHYGRSVDRQVRKSLPGL